MYCCRCNKHIGDCTCPDIEERLAKIGQSDKVVMGACLVCKKHISRCKCTKAVPAIMTGGEIISNANN